MDRPGHTKGDGGVSAAVPFHQVWLVDFEYRGEPGERPQPVCMVAREFHSGREIRLWREELRALAEAPFDTGPDSVLVAYAASAELGCFLELGWPLPHHVLDLYVEHLVAAGGVRNGLGNGLLGALHSRGLAHMDAVEKRSMIELIVDQSGWSQAEQQEILNYCASDVDALARLLPAMQSGIDWPRALHRGRYMAAVAVMERNGVPIDGPLFERLRLGWPTIRGDLIAAVDADYSVYDGSTFKADRFRRYLESHQISWPPTATGLLKRNDATFKEQSALHPELKPLRELRQTLASMNLFDLPVGSDDRNRCSLMPFRSITGRNQPSTSKFIFGPAKFLRGLIRPPEGHGLAYIDFSAQEIAIAAGLSGDKLMAKGYADGDPYLAFAIAAKLEPTAANRERCKALVLGINYGMGEESLAAAAGIPPVEAGLLMQLHQQTYRKFWLWREETVAHASMTNEMRTVFGWRRRLEAGFRPTSVMNFPMQANGAEMMRIAAIAATEAGIEVCAPIHDAFLITAPLDTLAADVERMREFMAQAGLAVTGTVPVRTDAKIYLDRYMDERGRPMWDRIMSLLDRHDDRVA